MRLLFAFCLMGMAALPAAAEEFFATKVISVVAGDINNDGVADVAMIVAPDEGSVDDNALAVLLGTGTNGTLALQTFLPNFVWGGGLAGTLPSLEIDERGSLRVLSQNEAVGRGRWSQITTIAWRDEAFVVAGYTYSFYDTLDPAENGSCDLNLLTGKGNVTRNGDSETLETDLVRVPVADWLERSDDDPCKLFEE